MTKPTATFLDIIRARNAVAYPFDKTDAELLSAADTLLKHSDNEIDHKDARRIRAQINFNAQERQAEALQGFGLYVQSVTSKNTGYVFWAACAAIFGGVGYIIGAVTQ